MENTLIVAGTLVLVAASLVLAGSAWRHPRPADDLRVGLSWIPIGTTRFRRSLLRAAVARAATMVSLLLLVASPAHFGNDVSMVVDDIGGVGILVSVVVTLCIMLTNRPKFLVPPHMRKDRGMLFRDNV